MPSDIEPVQYLGFQRTIWQPLQNIFAKVLYFVLYYYYIVKRLIVADTPDDNSSDSEMFRDLYVDRDCDDSSDEMWEDIMEDSSMEDLASSSKKVSRRRRLSSPTRVLSTFHNPSHKRLLSQPNLPTILETVQPSQISMKSDSNITTTGKIKSFYRRPKPTAEKIHYPIATLCNMGNTCFLNCILYALRCCTDFVHNVHHMGKSMKELVSFHEQHARVNYMEEPGTASTAKITIGLHKLFMIMHSFESLKMRIPVRPVTFVRNLKRCTDLDDENQQDAHEYLMTIFNSLLDGKALIDHMLQSMRRIQEEQRIWNIFVLWRTHKLSRKCGQPRDLFNFDFLFQETTKLTCLECGNSRQFVETALDLKIAVTMDELDDTPDEIYKRSCVTAEILTGCNQYACNNCEKLTDGLREVSYAKLPDLLIFQMKRFTFSNMSYSKVNFYFPTPLELACFCVECCNADAPVHHYQLSAVVLHIGRTLNEGHYITYCRLNPNTTDKNICTEKCCAMKINKNAIVALQQTDKSQTADNKANEEKLAIKIKAEIAPDNNSKSERDTSDIKKKGVADVNEISMKDGIEQTKIEDAKKTLNVYEPKIEEEKSKMQGGEISKDKDEEKSKIKTQEKSKSKAEQKSKIKDEEKCKVEGDSASGDTWLQCDDGSAIPISEAKIIELLSPKEKNNSSPYLLFYTKVKKVKKYQSLLHQITFQFP